MNIRRAVAMLLALVLMVSMSVAAQDAEALTCEDGFQPVTDIMGTMCISENIERVVVLEWTYVEDVLALGVQPVGVADIEGYNNWVKIPVTLEEGVTDVGLRGEPNLEILAGLNPDLIIGTAFRMTENYDDLSAIAPTLVFNPYPEDLTISQYDEMLNTFTTIAGALNRVDEGAAVLEHMEGVFTAAEAALTEAGRDGEGFILSQGWTAESVATFRLFTDNAMAVQILARTGLTNDWTAPIEVYGFSTIGMEGFAEVGDTNFFYVAQQSDEDIINDMPIWGSLPFVKSERAYWIGGDVWLFGGPLSAEVLVDTILSAMGVELPEPEVTLESTIQP